MARSSIVVVKAAVWAGCLIPLLWLTARGFGVFAWTLGANPVETVLHTLGKTGLNLLLLTLAVTPARRLTGFNTLIRVRRLLGLFSFFYVTLHFLTYTVLDLRLEWGALFVDVTQRPYITVGMLALAGMIPLAATSTHAMQRRLGRRWLTLHKAIYPIAVLALTHLVWQTKSDIDLEAFVYAGILVVLLGYRVAHGWLRRRSASARDQ